MDFESCTLCPRNCRADRLHGSLGYCGQTASLKAARAALHMWEEPCISGENGSGTIFFSGCPLRCVFCQNREIALAQSGLEITYERLIQIFFELEKKGANNINLVTPTHFVPIIVDAIKEAKNKGLTLPLVYNTSSYENVDTIQKLENLVDIYLPDFKYYDEKVAKRYANAPDYRKTAQKAIAEMVRQVGEAVFDEENGLMQKGVIVRHLVLPGQIEDSKRIIRYLYETYGDAIYISIMNQFTPINGLEKFPEINRTLTEEEYEEVVDYAIEIGVENGFIQEGETATESFIPPFDYEGI